MIGSQWRKSSASSSNANCVEARTPAPGVVQVRDSKDRSGPGLSFTADAWAAFLSDVKDGEFRLPD